MNSYDKIMFGVVLSTIIITLSLILASPGWWPPSTYSPQPLPYGEVVPLPPPEKRLTSDPSEETWPVWSPDNWHLAYMSNRYGNWSIWTMCEDGSSKQQLTSNSTIDMYPAWSPDGKRIAYLSQRLGQWDVWVMYSDGTGKVNLTDDDASEGPPVWSPDGSRLLFESNRSGNLDIWVISSSGYYINQLTKTPAEDRYPSWSPDGERVVFASNRTGNFDIWIMDADGSNTKQLTTNPEDDIKPLISPKRDEILYLSRKPFSYSFYIVVDVGGLGYTEALIMRSLGEWGVWRMMTDGRYPRGLTIFLEDYSKPSWSSDGKSMLFSMHRYKFIGHWMVEAEDDMSIVTTDRGGMKPTILVAFDGENLYPAWSPDGKKIAFTSNTSGNFEIWMISTEAGGKIPEY